MTGFPTSDNPIEPTVRNAWYAAVWGHGVGAEPLARTPLGEEAVLFRDSSGRVGILEDRCRHRVAPLSLGAVVEAVALARRACYRLSAAELRSAAE